MGEGTEEAGLILAKRVERQAVSGGGAHPRKNMMAPPGTIHFRGMAFSLNPHGGEA
jgi:hypothetical protein